MVRLSPVSTIQSKDRKRQAHRSLYVSWEGQPWAVACGIRGRWLPGFSSLRSPPAQKSSDLFLHQKPSELHPMPSAPMADEGHQEHGGQEAVQGPDEEVHGKKKVAGNVGSVGMGCCSSD